MRRIDEEEGGDPPCWAHLFEEDAGSSEIGADVVQETATPCDPAEDEGDMVNRAVTTRGRPLTLERM